MKIFTREFNAALGQIKMIATEMPTQFRSAVATVADLPVVENAEGDLRMAIDTDHLFAFVNGAWIDQGAFDVSDLLQEKLMQSLS